MKVAKYFHCIEILRSSLQSFLCRENKIILQISLLNWLLKGFNSLFHGLDLIFFHSFFFVLYLDALVLLCRTLILVASKI